MGLILNTFMWFLYSLILFQALIKSLIFKPTVKYIWSLHIYLSYNQKFFYFKQVKNLVVILLTFSKLKKHLSKYILTSLFYLFMSIFLSNILLWMLKHRSMNNFKPNHEYKMFYYSQTCLNHHLFKATNYP